MTVVIGFNWPLEHDNAVAVILDGRLVLPVRKNVIQDINTRLKSRLLMP